MLASRVFLLRNPREAKCPVTHSLTFPAWALKRTGKRKAFPHALDDRLMNFPRCMVYSNLLLVFVKTQWLEAKNLLFMSLQDCPAVWMRFHQFSTLSSGIMDSCIGVFAGRVPITCPTYCPPPLDLPADGLGDGSGSGGAGLDQYLTTRAGLGLRRPERPQSTGHDQLITLLSCAVTVSTGDRYYYAVFAKNLL